LYSLRQATADDAAFVYHLHRSTMQDYVAQTWGAWNEEFQARMFTHWFEPARFQIVVVDDQDAGLVSVQRRPTELFLNTLEILPAYQNRGVGAAVIRSILAQGQAEGLPVALQVLKVNPARQLYARLGFTVVGETTTHYRMRAVAAEPPA
jgi:ribosomal protein S18 acetylase RimI-like enzyme